MAIGSTDIATRKSMTAVSGIAESGTMAFRITVSSCTSFHCVTSTSSQFREAARKVLAMSQNSRIGSTQEKRETRHRTVRNIAAMPTSLHEMTGCILTATHSAIM